MKLIVRSAVTLVLAASAFSTLPGCTAEEVAATALVIGAVAIVSDGDVSTEVRDHRHERRERRGHRNDERYGSFDRGPRGPRNHYAAVTTEAMPFTSLVTATAPTAKSETPKFKSSDARVINLANNYEISHYAATYLVHLQ